MIQILASLVFLVSLGALAQDEAAAEKPVEEAPAPAKGYTLCKNRKIVRGIRVEKDPNGPEFLTIYTKSGKDREVGRAKWRPSAVNIQTNIKKNLIKAGWDCKDSEQFEISSSQ